jgi:hypothetical protein
MTLLPHEVAHFYRVWWLLLSYVNDHVRAVSDLPPDPPAGSVSPADAAKVRNALWNDDSLREKFVAQNPAGLSPEDRDLVASWSRRVSGRFYLYRHLKKHTVVLSASGTPAAYGVLGLVSTIPEVVPLPPPVLVEMVLLPFEDRITYDGLLAPYNITFGSGIRSSLDDEYRAARERGGIITSLAPAEATRREDLLKRLQAGNALVIKEFRKDLAASGLSGNKMEEHVTNVEALAGALLRDSDPRPLLEVSPDDLRAALALRGPGSRVSFKRLARFLERSGRVEWGSLQEMAELG